MVSKSESPKGLPSLPADLDEDLSPTNRVRVSTLDEVVDRHRNVSVLRFDSGHLPLDRGKQLCEKTTQRGVDADSDGSVSALRVVIGLTIGSQSKSGRQCILPSDGPLTPT